MKTVKVFLLDKNGEVQYGLNWGQRENRDPNQAYLQLTPDIYKSDFFPSKGKYFVVETDDNKTFIMTRAQKDFGTALQIPENNALLGEYLRKRLGLQPGVQITKEDILNYGISEITFHKKDDMHFLMTFNDKMDRFSTNRQDLPLQVIYYGAPGTGKSFEIDSKTDDDNSVRTTFHPDSDYASFVGAYKPTMEDVPISAIVGKEVHAAVPQGNHSGKEKKIVYKYVPQAFLKAYVAAWSDLTIPQYLVIEEINRGNCAQIFGDLFQLLDRNNSGASSYPIHADEDIKQFLKDDKKGFAGLSDELRQAIADFTLLKDNGDKRHIGRQILDGELLLLPPNLHIWATMNTSDQSLFPIDSAFKRRWDWKYIPISYVPKDKKTGKEIKWKFNVGENLYSWGEFLSKINPEIYTLTESSDKQMGYFFAKADPKTEIISEDVFLNKVLFYLWTEVLKDYTTGQKIFINPETNKTFVFTDFFDDKQNALENFIANLKLEEVEEYEPEEDSENPRGTHFVVDGIKTSTITKALCMILSEAAKSKTYSEILEEVPSNIKRSDPILKKVDNPSEYQKENGWKNMIIKTTDDISFVVTNQWKKEMIPMIANLADALDISFEYNLTENDTENNSSEKTSNRDYGFYSVNNEGRYNKRKTVLITLQKYLEINKDLTPEEIISNWEILNPGKNYFLKTQEEYEEIINKYPAQNIRYSEVTTALGEKIYLTNQWGGEHFELFIEKMNSSDFGIHIEKID